MEGFVVEMGSTHHPCNAFLLAPCVLEIVVSTVNTTVNNRDRGLAFLVMLVTLRSEQTIIKV